MRAYAPDIPEDRMLEAPHAPTPTSKASSRGYAARNECPDCRSSKTMSPGPKGDGDAGAGSAGSAATGQSTGIAIGA